MGPDVVVVAVGDEEASPPVYAPLVRAVFKTYGYEPDLGPLPLRRPRETVMTLLKYVRDRCRRAPLVRAYRKASGVWPPPNVFPLPLGYARQVHSSFVPVEQRRTDVRLDASLRATDRPEWLQRLVPAPRRLARQAAFAALDEIARSPDIVVGRLAIADYRVAIATDPAGYSQRLADTRIAILPRGAVLETARTYEAARAGCVLVSLGLPNRPFMRRCPAVILRGWNELPALVEDLLAQPERLRALSAASLRWWAEDCSETVIGAAMAEHLITSMSPSDLSN